MLSKIDLVLGCFIVAVIITGSFGSFQPVIGSDTLYQTSTYSDLEKGIFDGNLTIGELERYGSTGLGTFNSLDGEMIILDGVVYQIKSNGTVWKVPDNLKTPFAFTTSFKTDQVFLINKSMNLTLFEEYMGPSLTSRNFLCMMVVIGDFSYLKLRSPPSQSKPYPNLTEALKNQSVWEFNNQTGVMVGLWCPERYEGTNFPGFHFHFISKDLKRGGHVLDYQLQRGLVKMDYTPHFARIQ